MIDLLGKKRLEEEIAELKSQIADLSARAKELQGERDRLSRQLEKREEKIRKQITAHQEVSLALKAADQKIAALQQEQKGEAAFEGKGRPKTGSGALALSPPDLMRLLERLGACRSPREDLVSAYLRDHIRDGPAEDLPKEVQDWIREINSDRGVAVFHCPMLFTIALAPPFPLLGSEVKIGGTFLLDPLRQMLDVPVLVVAARAGETLLGVALDSEGFEEHQVVKSTVKEKHAKGGWSQKRFERLREEDIRQHADLVKKRLPPLLEGYRQLLVYAVVSGDPSLTKQILPVLDLPLLEKRVGRFDQKRIESVLNEVYGSVCYRLW